METEFSIGDTISVYFNGVKYGFFELDSAFKQIIIVKKYKDSYQKNINYIQIDGFIKLDITRRKMVLTEKIIDFIK